MLVMENKKKIGFFAHLSCVASPVAQSEKNAAREEMKINLSNSPSNRPYSYFSSDGFKMYSLTILQLQKHFLFM